MKKGLIPASHLCLFLLWPFASLFFSVKNISKIWGANLLWLCLTFYGFCFVVDYSSGYDSIRYMEKLEWSHQEFSVQYLVDLFTLQTSEVDFYQPVITWMIAAFTESYNVLFCVFGSVAGFFLSRNAYLLLKFLNSPNSTILLFVFSFSFIVSIGDAINGVRMWTAALCFTYGLINIFMYKKKLGLWIITSTIFIHFSFLLPIVIFFSSFFVRKLGFLTLFGVYILSFSLSVASFSVGRTMLNYLPSSYETRAYGFVSEEVEDIYNVQEQTGSHKNIFARIQAPLRKYMMLFFLVLALIFRWHNKFDPGTMQLLTFSIVISIILNIFGDLPSIRRFARLEELSFMLSILGFLKSSEGNVNLFNNVLRIMSPLYFISVLYSLRVVMGFIDYNFVFGNVLTEVFVKFDKSIYDSLNEIF